MKKEECLQQAELGECKTAGGCGLLISHKGIKSVKQDA